GQEVATLHGHAALVSACAVTPDGRRVVSASYDQTLKVWDLESGACLLTHRANAGYRAVAATGTAIIAGDINGSVWFLDLPPAHRHASSIQDSGSHDDPRLPSLRTEPARQRPPMKHRILFLAANPLDTDRLALDEECAAIERELRMSP